MHCLEIVTLIFKIILHITSIFPFERNILIYFILTLTKKIVKLQ